MIISTLIMSTTYIECKKWKEEQREVKKLTHKQHIELLEKRVQQLESAR